MSAIRDCNCFLSTNYFIDKIGKKQTIKYHFSYNGTVDSIKQQLNYLGITGDNNLTDPEFKKLKDKLDMERKRRFEIDAERDRRRVSCRHLMEGRRKHPEVYTNIFKSKWLDERCIAGIKAASSPGGATRSKVLAAMEGKEIVKGRVFAFPILNDTARQMLDAELKSFGEICADVKSRPNSMNRFGVLLHEAGMTESVSDPLLHDVIVPLSTALFSDESAVRSALASTEKGSSNNGGKIVKGEGEPYFSFPTTEKTVLRHMCETLDHHHAFTVDYRADPGYDKELATHYDNAEVTLNVLLASDDFDGGELAFEGPSSASPPSFGKLPRAPVAYEHEPGWAVLHLGSELHRALPLDDGSRRNLIVWCRSAQHRLERGCPMCGEKDELVEPVLRRYLQGPS